MQDVLLRFDDVSKVYKGATPGLSHVSFAMDAGEFVAVIGPSGAGKSTLLRSVNRLQDITSGRILIRGEDISRASGRRLRAMRAGIGMIFQNYNLVYRLSAIQNVLHGRLGHMPAWKGALGLFSEEDKEKAAALLEEIQMGDFLNARASDLSGGQKQRVGIARAFMQEPELLLCDEPIASLDPSSAKIIMEMLRAMIRRRHMGCITILHQIEAARTYADRIIGLRRGQIVFDGPPEALTDAAVEAIYGAPAADLLRKERAS